MIYNRSPQHKANLEIARQAASQKRSCQYCETKYSLGNIKRHETSCYLNPTNKRQCIVCENPIKNYKTSETCGYACSNTHFRSGPKNGNWNPDHYRTTCFHYHKKECVVCKEKKIVEVHHLDENHANNSPENLIPLCPTHHQYWHSQYKSEIEHIVLEYIKDWSGWQ